MFRPKSGSLLNKPLEKFRMPGFQNFWSYGMSIRAQTLIFFAKSEFLGFKVFRAPPGSRVHGFTGVTGLNL